MIIDAKLNLKGIYQKGNDLFKLGGPVQKYIDYTILQRIEPYVPFRTGATVLSAIQHSRIGQGLLIWKTPYVRFIYRGVHMNFSKAVNPKAGAYWADTYKANDLQTLTGMVRERVKQLWR